MIRCLRKPTPTLRPAMRRGVPVAIDIASFPQLPVVGRAGGEARPAGAAGDPEAVRFCRLLRDPPPDRRHHPGLGPARLPLPGIGAKVRIVRGLEVELEFDESQYVGTGVFLFASVLERFFALYASINSFTELVMRTRQREGIVKRWRPRAAEQIVL